jgi:hypothetical protein
MKNCLSALLLLTLLSLEASHGFMAGQQPRRPHRAVSARWPRVIVSSLAMTVKNSSEAAHEDIADFRQAMSISRTNGDSKHVSANNLALTGGI